MTPKEYGTLLGEEEAALTNDSTPSPDEKPRLSYQESTTSPLTRNASPSVTSFVKEAIPALLGSTLVVSRRHRFAIVAIGAFLVVGLSQVGNLGVETDRPLEAREVATFISVEPEVLGETVASGPARTVVSASEETTTTTVATTTTIASFAEIITDVDVEPAPDQVSLSVSPELPTGNCHPSYEPCIPDVNYDLTCDAFTFAVEILGGADPYGFDPDGNGIGCERSE